MKAKCVMKLVDKRMSKDLMQILGLEETIDYLAKDSSIGWYWHVMRQDKNKIQKRH